MKSPIAAKVLVFTTLYPNTIQKTHGIFVENRLQHLVSRGVIDARVIAPVPWFPFRSRVFGRYADFARVPFHETRFGIKILHPRYPIIPKMGMTLAPLLLYRATKAVTKRLIDSGFDFDLIDAHYFYPDGVAAVLLGIHFKKPVVITAHGTDINLIPGNSIPRNMIRWTANRAAGLVTVSQALKRELQRIETGAEGVRVFRNGVDLSVFGPVDRDTVRKQLSLHGPTILSVGNLIPLKGHDIVIKSLPLLPDMTLLIVGEGLERSSLERLAKELGVDNRVRFLGTIEHERMCEIYSATDALVLASDREGLPCVLLESMACGTPVIASAVGGVPEVIRSSVAGDLLTHRDPEAVANSVKALLAKPPCRADTRAYAEQFDWSSTTQGQLDLFREILKGKAAA